MGAKILDPRSREGQMIVGDSVSWEPLTQGDPPPPAAETQMTIDEALQQLGALKTKHGGATLVYFDCPRCAQAFSPDIVVAEAVHLTGKPAGGRAGKDGE